MLPSDTICSAGFTVHTVNPALQIVPLSNIGTPWHTCVVDLPRVAAAGDKQTQTFWGLTFLEVFSGPGHFFLHQ